MKKFIKLLTIIILFILSLTMFSRVASLIGKGSKTMAKLV